MKNKILKIFLLIIFFLLIFVNKVEATPGNNFFEDDEFYKSIIDSLNKSNYNFIKDRDINYNVTDEELESIKKLECGNLNKTIYSLKGLEKLTSLEDLRVSYPSITNIDISKNVNLKNISIINANNLKEIDFSYNKKLESIDLTYTHLNSLDLSNCPNVTMIMMGAGSINDATIEELDLSSCSNLAYLCISGNKLKTVDLSQNKKLAYLNISQGTLEQVILPENSEITSLALFNNNIKSLENIKNFKTANNLKELYMQGNEINDFSEVYEKTGIENINIEDQKEYITIKPENNEEKEYENLENEKEINQEKDENIYKEDIIKEISIFFFVIFIFILVYGIKWGTIILIIYILYKYLKILIKGQNNSSNSFTKNTSKKEEYKYPRSEEYYNDLSGRSDEDKRL